MDRLFEFTVVDNCVKVDYRYNLGHSFGECLVSPDNRYRLIYIPKNGSTQLKHAVSGWKKSNFLTDTDKKIQNLVLFRDPTERWISGVAEFLVGKYSYMGNVNKSIDIGQLSQLITSNLFQNLLFHFGIFDGHTLPQAWYVNGINLNQSLFFFVDHDVMPKLCNYLDIPSAPTRSNTSQSDPKKTLIVETLKTQISQHAEFQKLIDVHFYADHQLRDCATFY